MNVNLMMRIADQIEQEPNSFNMYGWKQTGSCGTIACVAGWAIELSLNENWAAKTARLYEYLGGKLLDISEEERQHLFFNYKAGDLNNKPLVPNALRWMAATGVISWNRALEFAECARVGRPSRRLRKIRKTR